MADRQTEGIARVAIHKHLMERKKFQCIVHHQSRNILDPILLSSKTSPSQNAHLHYNKVHLISDEMILESCQKIKFQFFHGGEMQDQKFQCTNSHLFWTASVSLLREKAKKKRLGKLRHIDVSIRS